MENNQQQTLPQPIMQTPQITLAPEKKDSKRIYMGILLIGILLLIVIGTVSVFFLNNKQLPTPANLQSGGSIPSLSPTHSSQSSRPEISIENGDVFIKKGTHSQALILKTAVIDESNSFHESVTAIDTADVSPDNTKLLLLADDGLSTELLYVADLSGKNIQLIGYALEAKWSPSGRYIAYTHKPADVGLHSVAVYDTKLKKDVPVNDNTQKNERSYENLVWLDNEMGVKAHFASYTGDMPFLTPAGEGETTLYLKH